MNDTHDDQINEPGSSGLRHNAEDEAGSPGLTRNKADAMSPGEILREGRLANDYSVDDLCAQTKLNRKTVGALEDNDFQALSQPVFAGGYYRQCAKVLDLDLDRLMAAYAAVADTTPKPRIDRGAAGAGVIPRDVTPGGGSRFRGLFVLLVIAVAAIAAIVFLLPSDRESGAITADSGNGNAEQNNRNTTTYEFNSSNDDSDDANSNATGTDSIAANQPGGENTAAMPGASGNDAGQARTGHQPGGRNVNQTLGLNPSGQPDANSADQDDSSQPSAPSVPPNRLVLKFDQRSWVRVTDANGNRMASGIFESGNTKEFNGKPPYKIKLGVAQGVKVSIGGQPVDVAGHTDSRGVAQLSVDAASADDAQSAG